MKVLIKIKNIILVLIIIATIIAAAWYLIKANFILKIDPKTGLTTDGFGRTLLPNGSLGILGTLLNTGTSVAAICIIGLCSWGIEAGSKKK